MPWSGWFTRAPAPAPTAMVPPTDAPPARNVDPDKIRAAVLNITRTDDSDAFPVIAPGLDAGATIPPMPAWTPGSRFGMCRNPRETTR